MNLLKIVKQNQITYFVLGTFFAILAAVVSYQGHLSVSADEKYRQLQADFLHKEKRFDNLFAKLTFDPRIKTTVDMATFCEENRIDDRNYIFYIYQDSLLSAWSSNEIPAYDYIGKVDTALFQFVDNKWVYAKRANYFPNKYIGYIVMNEESDAVEYLPLSASIDNAEHAYTIKNSKGEDAFYLAINKELEKSDLHAFLIVCLWLIAFSLLYFNLVRFLVKRPFFKANTNRIFLIIIPLLYLPIKIFFSFVHFPEDLFSSMYYSSSVYGSLGELFIYSYATFFLSTLFTQYLKTKSILLFSRWIKIALALIFSIGVLSLDITAYQLIKRIANDSFIVLNPEMIYQFNILSITVILSIVFILWTVFIFTYRCFWEIFHHLRKRKLFILILLSGFFCVTLFILIFMRNGTNFVSYFLFLLLISVIAFSIIRLIKWGNIIFQTVIYLILSTIVLYSAKQTVEEREAKYKESVSEKMFALQDPYVFYGFSELAADILADTNIKKLFYQQPYNPTEMERYLVSTYLNKYTAGYRVSIETALRSDSLHFNKLLHDNYIDRISPSDKVSFRSIDFGKSEYMLNLPFTLRKTNDAGRIFIVFRSYMLSEEQSDMEEPIQRQMDNYSYAGYEGNCLKMSVNKQDIPYRYKLSDYGLDTIYSGMKFTREGMEHTVFKHDEMVLLVSSYKGMIWGRLAFVIILFFVQFIFSIIPISLSMIWGNKKMLRPGFQDALQFYITALVAVTIITTAILFSRFFTNLRNFDRLEVRNQMANKVKEILTKSLENRDLDDLTPEFIQYSRSELEAFFNIDLLDLNLYNNNGELIKSYGKGIYISVPINPFVLKQFSIDKYGAVTMEEEFGKEKYKSFYRTVTNRNGDVVGYLNMLAFSEKYNMLDHRHAHFFALFLLICLLTTLLIVFFSMFLIRRLIRPLSNVTERLLNISLWDEASEIEWNRDDEFGKLVETYNFLIAKLRTSTELLERNSQELAWKDMARQVAHEIKNPLTPIRLTTQQIMRQLEDGNLDRERLSDYFKMILAQTDALNEIASSFSSFARVNQGDGSSQDLFSILKNTIASYNEKDVEILLENNTGQEAVLSIVSRSQMMQVFNNLLKNAIQAKKPDQKQIITIVLQNHGDKMWQIQLSDTGTGMTDNVKEKLFQPNFTTKTSGMGLGLAVVKQIITAKGGNISVESTLGEGTTFWITLPKDIENYQTDLKAD